MYPEKKKKTKRRTSVGITPVFIYPFFLKFLGKQEEICLLVEKGKNKFPTSVKQGRELSGVIPTYRKKSQREMSEILQRKFFQPQAERIFSESKPYLKSNVTTLKKYFFLDFFELYR